MHRDLPAAESYFCAGIPLMFNALLLIEPHDESLKGAASDFQNLCPPVASSGFFVACQSPELFRERSKTNPREDRFWHCVVLMRRNLGLQHFQHVLKVKLSWNSLKNGVFKYVGIKAFRTFYSSPSY